MSRIDSAASPNSVQLRRIHCKATDTTGLKRQGSSSVFSGSYAEHELPAVCARSQAPKSDLLAHAPFETQHVGQNLSSLQTHSLKVVCCLRTCGLCFSTLSEPRGRT
ncbi:UNVERIFIED_CONTAM: hypothetical protein K2H54_022035 [Gekko kuhli]